ncbi:MAG: calcium/sodium antiporter [Flavobacteriales bacterium]|nr:calcium/sodium antiporter [Bacteroidota bacterium]MCB9241040.1 calcium/sodium antiporter [Flavobacteriales bacterium]
MGLDILFFVVALTILLIAAKYFTEAAERIGLAMHMSPFMVGVVIVAVGTSLPELIAGIFASTSGKTELVIGNVIGANVSNIFLILGVTSLASRKSIHLGEEYIFIDLHFMLGSSAMLVLFLMDGTITWIEGVLLLVGFVVYQVYLARSEKPEAVHTLTEVDQEELKRTFPWKDVAIVILAATGVFFGAKYTVESVISIATSVGVNEAILGLTAMSIGTTLPELTVSIAAARAGKPEIAVGNILGSCIFNAFSVCGVTSLIHPISLPEEIHWLAISFLITASVFFYLLSQDKKVSRFEGMLFLLFYIIFVLKIAHIA